jgi:outer membrane receptor protein involved in Fe transport
MSSPRHSLSPRLALACGLALAAAAQAQPAGQRAAPALEEVIVTAQRRAENVLEVPIAISVFNSESLRDTGAAQLADFLQSAPGVGIVDDQSGTQNVQIRGINSTYGNAPVGYYLDEMPFTYIGNTQVPDVRTFDLDRIEILRGPQGTLYGDGSIGGTIRILTTDPDLQSLEGSAELDAATISDGEDNFAVRGMLNVPLKEDVAALRLVGTYEDLGGWVDNSTSGKEDQNGREIDNYRGKLRWAPIEDLDIVLSYWHTSQDVTGNGESLPDRTTPNEPDDVEMEYDLYGATVRYSFSAFDIVSATSYMDYSNDSYAEFFGAPFTIFEEQELLSQEVRLTSTGDGALRWTAGVFYRDIDRKTLVDLSAFGFTQDQTQESQSWAVFGEATLALLDRRLELTLGARYFEDDRLFKEPLDDATLEFIQSVYPDFEGQVEPTFDTFNPRLNVFYRVSDDWGVYGNIAKGFRSGQAQPVISLLLAASAGVVIPTAIEQEELWSYEIGTKGTFLDGRGVFEGAIYYNDWDDIQTLVVVNPQPRVAALINGGTARTSGIEGSLTLLPLDGLSLQLGASYVDAEYTESIEGTPVQDGDPIVGVPEWTASASATYRWPLWADVDGFAFGGVQYASKREDVASSFQPSESVTKLDLRLGLERESWGVYLYADNLTDEDGAIDASAAGPDGLALRYRPRTWGLTLRYDF